MCHFALDLIGDLFIPRPLSAATFVPGISNYDFLLKQHVPSVCVDKNRKRLASHLHQRERSPINFYVTACDHSFVFSPENVILGCYHPAVSHLHPGNIPGVLTKDC